MEEVTPFDASSGLSWCRQVLHPVLALASAVCLLGPIGWTGQVTHWQHWTTVIAGFIFAAERSWTHSMSPLRSRERRRLLPHLILAGLALAISAAMLAVSLFVGNHGASGWYLTIQAIVIASGLASLIHHQTRFTAKAFHPGWMLMGSFLGIIIAGTLLLKMPLCVVPGQTCSWLDAAFTSTSAVCVTGLAVQNTATFFSQTGQVVILLLIQVGGLGIMTLTFFAAVVLFEGLSLHDRLLLGRMIQDNRLSQIGRTLTFIVSMTFTCEALGAVILFASLDLPAASIDERLFHAVFHSVSAFCNAGFSTLPDNLASPAVRDNATWQICIMLLIITGGIGTLVAEDVVKAIRHTIRRWRGREITRPRMRVHTRLVLTTTAILVFGGGAVIWVCEFLLWNGPSNGGSVLTALFHSVTARTAGFNTVSMPAIGPLTVQVLMVLMWVGGSPGGTAGGVRTTVVAVGLGYLWNELRQGKRGMVAFNRTIPQATGTQALCIILLSGIWLGMNYVALRHVESHNGIQGTRLLFELISAFATVGLSIDLTPLLSDHGKSILILNMFVGRIGLLTVFGTLIPPDHRPRSGKPGEDILIN